MILRNATIKYKGYDPLTLSKESIKRICVVCNECGRVRWVVKRAYRDLCRSCSNVGRKHSDEVKNKISKIKIGIKRSEETKRKISKTKKGKKLSDETCQKMSESKRGKFGKDSNNWKGGISNDRSHVLPINQCLKLNEKFEGSEGHHISSDVIIYIPKELHHHFYHSLKNNKGMAEMNLLAYQFLKGWL